jgi:hypothetical protein
VPDALRAFMDETPHEVAPPPTISDGDGDVPPPVVPAALRPFAFEPFDSEEEDDDDDGRSFSLPLATLMPRAFDAPSASAPAHVEPAPVEMSGDEDDEDDALAVDDESYPSLLEMTNPFRQREEFVRVDEPETGDEEIEPAVVFPGQEPGGEAAPAANPARPFDAPHQAAPNTAPVRPRVVADPAETDRALRAALANLQRMSGAA